MKTKLILLICSLQFLTQAQPTNPVVPKYRGVTVGTNGVLANESTNFFVENAEALKQVASWGHVRLVKPTGAVSNFIATANTDAARGALLTNVQALATSGDTIKVGAGTYELPARLGKNGVNWVFEESLVTSALNIFGDGNSAMTFTVSGNGRFNATFDSLCSLENDSSDVSISGRWFAVDAGAGFASVALFCNGSTVRFSASEYIRSDDYDAVWVAAGNATVTAPVIEGADQGVEVSSGTARVVAGKIIGASNPIEIGTGAVRIIGAELISAGNGSIVNGDSLTLENCSTTIAGSNSFNSVTNRRVTVVGSLSMNKAPAASITFVGGLINASYAPASSTEINAVGTIRWDSNYIYVWTATNEVKRAALSTW